MRRPRATEAAARQCAERWVAVSATEHGLIASVFPLDSREDALSEVGGAELPEGDLSARAAEQLAAFFSEQPADLDFPLDLRGVPEFTAKAMCEIARIPWGATRTYGEIAALVGNPKASRAIGQVNARNPLAPFVPCHRVLGSEGLHGYAGGLPLKQRLLDLEQRVPAPR